MKPTKILFVLLLLGLLGGIAVGQKSKIVTAAQANGTYRVRDNEIKVLALGHNKLKVQFDLTYAYKVNGELTANTGFAVGEADIENDVATYHTEEFGPCTITLTFLPGNKLKVAQEGSDFECGFGHNVTADGTYRKVKGGKPTFDNPEDR